VAEESRWQKLEFSRRLRRDRPARTAVDGLGLAAGLGLEQLLDATQKGACLHERLAEFAGVGCRKDTVVGVHPSLKGTAEMTRQVSRKQARLHEVVIEQGDDAGMASGTQVSLRKQGAGRVEHGVVDAVGSNIETSDIEQKGSVIERFSCAAKAIPDELVLRVAHSGTPSRATTL